MIGKADTHKKTRLLPLGVVVTLRILNASFSSFNSLFLLPFYYLNKLYFSIYYYGVPYIRVYEIDFVYC